ncbi:TetR/AcrR family transcriptional regulator [Pseudohaliea sp.]|uniref:TetR/AcrR family transcriptional regulator n=1 Tax=Pseudohaliea sp. TaxID=2740289 RepID=UPI0032EC8898
MTNQSRYTSVDIASTKEKLLLTALTVFAERGIDAVSIRALTKMAGAGNTSAVYYHFDSKQGLIETLINFIQDKFDEVREPMLSEIELDPALGPKDLRRFLFSVAKPYVHILEREQWGECAIRFLARIEYEDHPEASKILSARSKPAANRMFSILKTCTQGIPDRRLRMRFNFFINTIIQGLANARHLKTSYLGDLSTKSSERLARFYVDCGEQVILAPKNKC